MASGFGKYTGFGRGAGRNYPANATEEVGMSHASHRDGFANESSNDNGQNNKFKENNDMDHARRQPDTSFGQSSGSDIFGSGSSGSGFGRKSRPFSDSSPTESGSSTAISVPCQRQGGFGLSTGNSNTDSGTKDFGNKGGFAQKSSGFGTRGDRGAFAKHTSFYGEDDKNDNVTSASGFGGFGGNHRDRLCDNSGSNQNGNRNGACRRCGNDGHFAKDCPDNKRDRACRRCGEESHFVKDCPQPDTLPKGCFNCGSDEHIKRDCTMLLGGGDGGFKTGNAAGRVGGRYSADSSGDFGSSSIHFNTTTASKPNPFSPPLRTTQSCCSIALAQEQSSTGVLHERLNGFGILSRINGAKETESKGGFGDKSSGFGTRDDCVAFGKKTTSFGNTEDENDSGIFCSPSAAGFDKVKSFLGFGSDRGGFSGNSDYGSSNQAGNRSCACRMCGNDGHFAKDCPDNQRGMSCKRCGEGHFVKDCPQADTRPKGCFNCGSYEHQKKDCTMPVDVTKFKPPNGGSCFNCGSADHVSNNCPEPRLDGRKPPSNYIPPVLTDNDIFDPEQQLHRGINFSKYDEIESHVQCLGDLDKSSISLTCFEDAHLHPTVRSNVKLSEYQNPTPVQKLVIPIIQLGRDVMACAQTGSGKTAAYLLPIINQLLKKSAQDLAVKAGNQSPYFLCIAPTRELSTQIYRECRKFAHGTLLKIVNVYGGVKNNYHMSQVQSGCHMIVGTPGRLVDYIEKGVVEYFVLDEADRMLEQGMESAIRLIVEKHAMPAKGLRQTLMFSATFPAIVQELAKEYLDKDYCFVTIGTLGGANEDVEQVILQVDQSEKRYKLAELLRTDLETAKNGEKYVKKTLIFVRQKRAADWLASYLSHENLPATSIHSDRLQNERELALRDFVTGRCPVLIATDVAARGLDIVGVDHVINFDLPDNAETYIHRIGRTGRIGNRGKATSFYESERCGFADELVKILSLAKQEVPEFLVCFGASGGTSFGNSNHTNTGAFGTVAKDGWN